MESVSLRIIILLAFVLLSLGCSTHTTRVRNEPGIRTTYIDPRTPGGVQGVGIESQDISAMTDQMVRDLMATPVISGRSISPRIVIDSQYFINESSSRINKNIITNKIRTNLNRASGNKIVFVERERTDMIEKERGLKTEGVVDEGTVGTADRTYGADFRMAGRITSTDAINPDTGLQQRTHYIFFSLVALETGEIAWENSYEFGKASMDHVIYR